MASHKEMTAHFRKLLKRDGIKARVRMFETCGQPLIQIIAPTYDATFTADECRQIAFLAKCNKLTGARGAEVDPDHEAKLTGKQQWSFEYHG